MKKVFKFIGGFILGVIVLSLITSILGDKEETGTNTSRSTETAQEQAKQKPQDEGNKITLENYNAIVVGDSLTGDGGMTIEEVSAVFGKEPDTKSESQSGDMTMIMAGWTAEGLENLGDNVSVTFINGRASSKSHFGLDQ